jgi:hypothetical protein
MDRFNWCTTPKGCITKAYSHFKKSRSQLPADDSEELSEEFDELLATLDNFNIIDEDIIDDLVDYFDRNNENNNKSYKLINHCLKLVRVN